MATHGWARVAVDSPVEYPLRRGAWYPILRAEPEGERKADEAVVLVVHNDAVVVPRSVLEITPTRPNQWTLVRREWALGGPYLVCPSCAARVSLQAPVERLSCDQCFGAYAVEADVRSENGVEKL